MIAPKDRRQQQRLTQADLAVKVRLPQGHISRIERGLSDIRISSLIELARALGLELMLVPKEYVPAVLALVNSMSTEDSQEPAYSLGNDDAPRAQHNATSQNSKI